MNGTPANAEVLEKTILFIADDSTYFLIRSPTISTTANSSGNSPVASFEYTNSPLTCTSKQPPVAGMSANSFTRVLNMPRILPVKLRAFGSYPQDVQYFNSIFIPILSRLMENTLRHNY